MDEGLHLRLFGPPIITLGETSLTERLPGKAQALLYYLAVTGRPQLRTTLAALLWGDLPEKAARANLRRVLIDLRQHVGAYLEIERNAVGFVAEGNIWADVMELTSELAAASSPLDVERLENAVALYQGDFLAGFFVRDALDFDSWAAAERERLREAVIQALDTLAAYYAQQGELLQGMVALRRILALEPWREEAHRQLMLLLARSGQRSAALAQFETCREVLAEELGVEPGAETKALYERIRDQDLRDLRLQPQTEPAGGHKPSPAPMRPAASPHNLPPQPTPLIGREKELTEIKALLAAPDCRLVTIVGLGGIGKTRLAIEAAQRASAQFADGVCFVPLASTDSVRDILPRIATAVDPAAYPTGQTAADFLPWLQQRDPMMLLVLDNLEQLLPEGNAAIEALLTQTRRLKLIVTSREALNIRWEWRYDLEGLAYPGDHPAEALESYSAVEMFLQRLRQTRRALLTGADVQAAARICRLVGGMPLGIELAAMQAAHFSCPTIATALERNLDALVVSLRDLPARQRSLRASFEVTWTNLPPDEQAVFRRLSLFRSSFSAEAAQAVAESGPLALINLIDKSLLRQVSPERYDLHPVLRHYAQEKLAEVPEERAQTLACYRDYYTAFLYERTEALQHDIDLAENVQETQAEIDNLLAGWVQIMEQDDGQEFASALVRALDNVQRGEFVLSSDTATTFERQQRLLERHSSEADICLMDAIWVDTLADHLLDLSEGLGEEAQNHFSVYIENNTVDGRLVALPFRADVGLLYYRPDLLAKYGFAAPPTTWDELEWMAAAIQAGEWAEGRTDFWGFVWQGRNYEGLTCAALEWQASHGGGCLIEPEGVITINNPHTIAAFERAARWLGTISPLTLTDIGDEGTTQQMWQAGNVAFMRHWIYFSAELSIDNRPAEEWLGVTRLPSGGAGSVATLGGHQIAISKYARYPQSAIELVRYAVSREEQLHRIVSPISWKPTIPDLYDDPKMVAAHPYMPKLKEMFSSGNLVARPSKVCGPLYPQVSKAYSTAVHSILTGQVEAARAVADLEAKLVEITGFPVGRPE